MRVLNAEEMRRMEAHAIEELGIPSLVLMENAAIGLLEAIAEHYPTARRVAIFCGPGNNGGDGLALARHLEGRGYCCHVFLLLGASPLAGDAAIQLNILQRSGIAVEQLGPASSMAEALLVAGDCDLLVDALFGTGLSRPLSGHFAAWVQQLAKLPVPRLAVDLPSGLDASQGGIDGPHLACQRSVTFAAPKVAHILLPAAAAAGEVVVADLGLPPGVVDGAPGYLHLSTAEELGPCLMNPPVAGHKGDFGHALLLAGSPGKSGAAVLAARAAVRGGAGLVTVGTPAPVLELVDGGSVESMSNPLPWDEDEGLSAEAAGEIIGMARGKAAVAMGPGLGLAAGTVAAMRQVSLSLPLPLLLDADGLNAFAGDLSELASRSAPTVLTPHPGEMGRLLGCSSAAVQADRLAAVREAAASSGAVVLLKGHQSLLASPDGEVYINPTGNPGMASGGSGDVLSGLLLALLSQGYEPFLSTQLAAYLHGLAGDLALLAGAGREGLNASQLIDALPRAFAKLRAVA